ncbi:MAG: sensor domain-containing protein [Fervidobacterium sp.]
MFSELVDYNTLKEELVEMFDALFNNVPDGVVIMKSDGTVLKCNKYFLDMFGFREDEVIGHVVDNLIVPETIKEEPKKLREFALQNNTLRAETIRKRKDGTEISVRLTVAKISENGKIDPLLYAFYTDISAEKEALSVVKNILQRDTLTGLYTRGYFIKKLSSLNEFSSIDDYHGLIYIDVNNFSQINILKGHQIGDELLKAIASRIKSSLREGDTIARPYADEFWILVEKVGKSYQQAREILQSIVTKILHEISKTYYIQNEAFDVKFSFGIHAFSMLDHFEEVMRKVNLALKRAKSSRDKVVFYSFLIDTELQEKSIKEKLLKEALYNKDLKVFLQPISQYHGRIIGAEALVRWVKKDGSVVPPGEFINLLEENGMIVPVGEEILRQVCEVFERIPSLEFIDVNVSPVQLRDQNMAERFFEILKAYGVDPSKIVIEITENILIDMTEVVKNNIEKLLSYGFQLCIDDFGTGYSSLYYLSMLPLKKIKIDRSFVFKLPEDKKSAKLLEAIYNIAKSFQLEAIPEGVEDEKQLEILSMIGFRLFQGYYFGKPMAVNDFIKRLTEN